MLWGNKPTDGGNLLLDENEVSSLLSDSPGAIRFIRPFYGSAEFIKGHRRFCLWIANEDLKEINNYPEIVRRIDSVKEFRLKSKAAETRPAAEYPHRFRQIQSIGERLTQIIPSVSSERREFLPVGLLPEKSIVSNLAFAIYDAPLWSVSIIASKLHLIWIRTVCGQLETRLRYSNTMGWNAFPLPLLTEKNKSDLWSAVKILESIRLSI